MKLTVYTERGIFTSKTMEATADEWNEIKDVIKQCAEQGSSFVLDTETGYVALGKELLRTAAFVVDEIPLKSNL